MKKPIKNIIAIFVLTALLACQMTYAETVRLVGSAEPNELVGIIVKNINDENITTESIEHVEVFKANGQGTFSANFELDNVQYDADGNISNYEFKSNAELSIAKTTVLYESKNELSVDSNGIVFVPLVDTFEKLGVTMTESPSGTFTGKGNNGEIIIVIGEKDFEVDWVDVELPAASKWDGNVAMVPAYAIEDALKTDAPVYNSDAGTLSIINPNPADTYEEEFDVASVVGELPSGTYLAGETELFNKTTVWSSETKGSKLTATQIDVSGESFTKAVRLALSANKYGEIPTTKAYQFLVSVNKKFSAGETGLLSFKARAPHTTDESGTATMVVNYEERVSYKKALAQQVNIPRGTEWQQYYFPLYNAYDDMWNDKGQVKLIFNVGGQEQTVDIADLKMVTFGADDAVHEKLFPPTATPYHGYEDDAVWRKEAYRRIERYRKGDASITVKDADGNPVPNAQITVKQNKNDFMFGVSICDNELLEEQMSNPTIQKATLELFNTGVCGVEMKTNDVRDSDGKNGIAMVNEYLRQGKKVRGHALMWDMANCWPFDDYKDLSYEELYRQVENYVLPTAYTFRGKIEQWDVLNEPYDRSWLRGKYGTRLYADIFKKVHEIDPDAKLYVNETGFEGRKNKQTKDDRATAFVKIIERMKEQGAPIDGVGIQAHCTRYLYPQGFYHQLDECASAVDEVAVTEYDFRNENSDYAAEHLRDTLLATFSHPKATSFTMWGYWDKMHWRSSAPFYDSSWNAKPALETWTKMVTKDFMTNESLATDNSGKASFRGFYGDYDIEVKVGGQTKTIPFSLVKNGENTIDITAGSSITASVSNVPEAVPGPIEYSSVKEAKAELEELYPRNFEGIIVEADFRGVVDKAVNGTDGWSMTGTSSALIDAADGMILADEGTTETNIQKSLQGTAYNKGNLSLEYYIETLDAKTPFEAKLALNNGGDCVVGAVVCAENGYSFETKGGAAVALDDNTKYQIAIELQKIGESEYKLVYSICKDGEAAKRFEETQSEITALENIAKTAIIIVPANTSKEIVKLNNVRVRYIVEDEIIEFSPIGYDRVVIDESLEDFDIASSEWTSYGTAPESAFEYQSYRHYLWGKVSDETTEQQIIAREFASGTSGETAKLEFDMYTDAGNFYSGNAAMILSIGDSGQTVDKTIFRYEFDNTLGSASADRNYNNGFFLNLLTDSGILEQSRFKLWQGYTDGQNRTRMRVAVTISPNSSGGYDAQFVAKDRNSVEIFNLTAENFATAAEFEKLDTIFVKSETVATNSSNPRMCGIKNLKLSFYGLEPEINNGVVMTENGKILAVPYTNITEKPFSAVGLVGIYDENNILVSVEKKLIENDGKKNGTINFNINSNAEDYFKIFV